MRKDLLKKPAARFAFCVICTLTMGIIIRTYVLFGAFVQGPSMRPALNEGDFVLVQIGNRDLQVGDVVVIKNPRSKLIKRIVALSNSTAAVENFHLYVNGQLVNENQNHPPAWDPTAFECRFSNIIKSADKELILLGDNRCQSADSRDFGPVSEEQVIGKVIAHVKLDRLWGFLNQ